MMTDVIIVGGGAAGLMAAYAAARRGLSTEILEKNEKTGKKIYITGKGRCNVTNACDFDVLINNQCRNKRFLYSALRRLDNFALMDLIESTGCRLKTERGNRVFPVSDHASDIIKALNLLAELAGAKIQLKTEVIDIRIVPAADTARMGRHFEVTAKNLRSGRISIKKARNVIIATGGLSYPSTGSTGDGYRFAENFGINVTDRYPSLTSLVINDAVETAELSGLTLKNVVLKLCQTDRILYEDMGEMLFTHNGISGPLVLTASSYAAEMYSQGQNKDIGKSAGSKLKDMYVLIDLKPALTEKQLDDRLIREIDSKKNQSVKNVMRSLLPASMIPMILGRTGIDPDKKSVEISREERHALRNTLKGLKFDVCSTGGFNEAVITKGGIDVREINPSKMECKRIPGLYFAGEVLDIDAFTGGFNLQNAFSTGFTAGDSVKLAARDSVN